MIMMQGLLPTTGPIGRVIPTMFVALHMGSVHLSISDQEKQRTTCQPRGHSATFRDEFVFEDICMYCLLMLPMSLKMTMMNVNACHLFRSK